MHDAGYEDLYPTVLVVDASATQDTITFRGLIASFMMTIAPRNLRKFVLFVEADRLGHDAQRALLLPLEAASNTVAIYTTSELDKIDLAIRSRAASAVFEFKYRSSEVVTLCPKRPAEIEYGNIDRARLRMKCSGCGYWKS